MGPTAIADTPTRNIVQLCLPRDQIVEKLLHEFAEKKLGGGISGDGNLVEIFTSLHGSFTVVKTTPRGVSCIVDFGESWQTIPQLESVEFSSDGFPPRPTPF